MCGGNAEADADRDMGHSHGAVITGLVKEVLVGGDFSALERFYVPRMVPVARRWIEPFRISFPDLAMTIVQLVSDGTSVAARFRCSGSHLGVWQGHAPTGRRFENVDEVYFFTFQEGLIVRAWGLEDSLSRFRQLGLTPR